MANIDSNVDRNAKNLLVLQDIFRRHQHEAEILFGVSYLEIELIQFVLKSGNQKMKDIADNFYIKLSTLTTIIDKAETHKLLKRIPSKEDRRVVYLEVTKKGEDIYNKYVEQVRDMSRRMAEILTMSPEALMELTEKMAKMPLI
jgi:DNA-binding MarR family transcriptional regulator